MNKMSYSSHSNSDCKQNEQLTEGPRLAFSQRLSRAGYGLQVLMGFAILLFLAGCETPPVTTQLPHDTVAQTPVVLSPGDIVKITFPGAPDFNQTQKIQADGKINLPMIGQVDAAGKSIASLQQGLEALYQPQLQNANVIVTLDTSLMPVVVGGAVTKPGKYFFDRPTTVLQAVMEAGGPDQFGTLGRVSVVRLINGQQRTEVMDLKPILRGEAMKAVYVRAGDVILVGESRF